MRDVGEHLDERLGRADVIAIEKVDAHERRGGLPQASRGKVGGRRHAAEEGDVEAPFADGRGRPSWSGPMAGNNSGLNEMKARGQTTHPLGKNPGDVWCVPTAAYRGAHFATFPPALIERPILATCPERVCANCGTPWWRSPVEREVGRVAVLGALRKSCACDQRDYRPGIVLDPFIGAGTVGVVAERHGRRWLGIELKGEYRLQAMRRIEDAREPKR